MRRPPKAVATSKAGDNWTLHDMRTDRGEQIDLSSDKPWVLEALVGQWNELDARFEADARGQPDAVRPGGPGD